MYLDLLLCTLAVGSLAFTISKSHISDPLRSWLHSSGPRWVYQLSACMFCLSFWISLPTLWYFPQPSIAAQITLVFAVQMAGSLWSGLFYSFIRPR